MDDTLVVINGKSQVTVDVREVMKKYLIDHSTDIRGRYPWSSFALRNLADIIISLGKESGVKIRVSFNDK